VGARAIRGRGQALTRWAAGTFKDDTYHGRGTLSLSEHKVAGRSVVGWKYQGEFQYGMKHGRGLLLDGEGGMYEGEFQDDRFHGNGTFRCKKFTYVGQYKFGQRHGVGKITYGEGGGWYEGTWHRGEPHGEGEHHYKGGGFYRGSWRMGERHGVGRRVWSTSAEYEGEWKDDKMTGKGVLRNAIGDTYVGEFVDDLYDGEGSLQLASGDRYVGQFRRGKYCGRGRFEYRGGGFYEGDYWALLRTGVKWRRDDHDDGDEEDGPGGMKWASGKGNVTGVKRRQVEARERKERLERAYNVRNPMPKEERLRIARRNQGYGRMLVGSEFDDPSRGGILVPAADGKRHGRGIRVWSSGARYEGDWFQDKMTGFGILIGPGPDGIRYEGQFVDGRKQGRGVCSWGHSVGGRFVCPLGRSHLGTVGRCIYDGTWHNSRMHGEGKFMCCDGRSFTGTFNEDKRNGFGVEVIMTTRQREVEIRRRGIESMTHVAEKFVGTYQNNVKEGHGTLYLVVGDILEGMFVNGKLHGLVKYIFAR
jgi:hypothetical protein